ncbi:hypothetical protein KAU32_01605 [bacterium]|nr:hypothetical protein [bacterium]
MKTKRKITVSDLREYEFCSVSWCIAKDLGEHTIDAITGAEKSALGKDTKRAKKAQSRGETAHWLYDFKRVIGAVLFLIFSGIVLWILLAHI